MRWRDILAAARQAPLDRETVAAVVADVLPGAVVRNVTPMTGGLASLLDLVTLEGASTDAVVLRRMLPEFGHGIEQLHAEHIAHDVAAAGRVPVPRVLWHDDDAAFGRPALVMEHVPGRPLVADLAGPIAPVVFASVIGAVHAVRPGPELPLLADLAAHRDLFGGPQESSRIVDAAALHAAVARLAPAFVADDVLIHGDLHGGNVLWDGSSITGVVDWPGARRGVRWYDEAYAVMDTSFAHSRAAGDRLLAALRARPRSPVPEDAAWALWTGVALLRALPSAAEWIDGYRATGCTVTADELDARFVAAVETWLDVHDER